MIHKPMKFQSIDPADLGKYLDGKFVIQQKVDGIRAQLVFTADKVYARSSLGEELKSTAALPIALPVIKHCITWPNLDQLDGIVFDGEIVDGAWWFFDITVDDRDLNPSDMGYMERLALLTSVFEVWPVHPLMKVLPTAITEDEKVALIDRIRTIGGEGVMVKNRDGKYRPNIRTAESLKAKFVGTADVFILARDIGASVKVGSGGAATGKLNASVGVFGTDGDVIELGNCSMIGKPDARVGDVVEIKFLYLGAGNRLVQPSVIRLRDDKLASECTIDQAELRMMTRKVVTTI